MFKGLTARHLYKLFGVKGLILYKATCFDFQEVIVRPFSERKNIKLQC
jgi:hypothetical protein